MAAMTRAHWAKLPLACCIGAAALLGACGGSTKTVSVAGEPPLTHSTQTTPTATSTTPTTTTPRTQTSPTTGTTRTAPEPAFTETTRTTGGGGGSAGAATALVRVHGYTPNDVSQYHPNQTLRVLVGTHTGSGDGYGQQAFFFVQGRYIGTDTASPSATLRVLAQSDTSVTLGYPLYRHTDPLCCPGGGQAAVRFELNNGKLAPAQPIPPLRSNSGLSRY
jgi:hypothetical protein